MRSSARVQIQVASFEQPLEGFVLHADRNGCRIALEKPVAEPVLPNTPALVRLATLKGAYQVMMWVESHQVGGMQLRFSGKPESVERRRHNRYTCELMVEFRQAETNGQEAEWQVATAIEISQGGMRLLLGSKIEVPERLEIRFWFLGVEEPVSASARKVYSRPRTDGRQVVGIAFEEITPEDRSQLARMFP